MLININLTAGLNTNQYVSCWNISFSDPTMFCDNNMVIFPSFFIFVIDCSALWPKHHWELLSLWQSSSVGLQVTVDKVLCTIRSIWLARWALSRNRKISILSILFTQMPRLDCFPSSSLRICLWSFPGEVSKWGWHL